MAAAALVAGLFALRWRFREVATPQAAIEELRALRDHAWAVPGYFAIYAALTTAFFPAVLFHLAAGATWGFRTAAILNLVAMNVAATLQFFLARALGRERVAGLFERYSLLKLDDRAREHGVRAIVAIRAIPLPTMLVNMSAGVSGIRWRDFALGTAIGATPYILIYTYFAAEIADGVAGAERRALIQGVIAGAAILLLSLGPKLWARWRRRQAGSTTTPTRES